MAPPVEELLDRYLEEGWKRRASHPDTWAAVDDIPDHELWAMFDRLRRTWPPTSGTGA